MQIQAPIQLAMEILLIRHTSTDYHSNNFDCKIVTLSIESYKVTNWGCEIIKANYVRKYGKVVHVYFNFTVKADHVAPYISLFALPCKPISMMEVLPPFFRRIDGTQIPTRYLSDYGVIQSTYTLDVSSDYVFEWVFICE